MILIFRLIDYDVLERPTSRPKSRVIVLGSGYDLDGEGLIVMVEIDSLHLIES